MKSQKKPYNRIKGALADAGITNKELAIAFSVREPTVSGWCTNTNQPSIEMLFRIADFLQIDVRELLVSNQVSHQRKK